MFRIPTFGRRIVEDVSRRVGMMHCSVLWLRFQHSSRDRTSLDFGHIVVNIASFTSNVNKDAVWRSG